MRCHTRRPKRWSYNSHCCWTSGREARSLALLHSLPFDDARIWQMLLSTMRSDSVVLRAAALPCMGRSLHLSLLQGSSSFADTLQQRSSQWLDLLFELSTDVQMPELRHACWESISQSSLTLSQWSDIPGLAHVAFLAWRVLVRLLSDESEVIRDDAAALAYASIAPRLRSLIALPPPSEDKGVQVTRAAEATEVVESLLSSSRAALASVTCIAHVVEVAYIHLATAFQPTESTLSFFLGQFTNYPTYGPRHSTAQHSATRHSTHHPPSHLSMLWLTSLFPLLCALPQCSPHPKRGLTSRLPRPPPPVERSPRRLLRSPLPLSPRPPPYPPPLLLTVRR